MKKLLVFSCYYTTENQLISFAHLSDNNDNVCYLSSNTEIEDRSQKITVSSKALF
jgi:hypothetical protein